MSSSAPSVLQCVAVCCSVLPCVAVCCSALQCAATCCSLLQCVAVEVGHKTLGSTYVEVLRLRCNVLQCDAVCCSVLQYAAVCYSACCSGKGSRNIAINLAVLHLSCIVLDVL